MPRFAAARVFALAVLAVVTSSCDSLTGKKDGSFTIGLSDATLTVNQGKTDTVLVTITRKDFDKDITLNATGVPSDVFVSFSPKILTGSINQSFLVLQSAPTAALGSGTITVRATAEGVTEQSGTVALTVGVTGSFTLAAHGSPATAAAASGGGAQGTVLVSRFSGHADNVSFTVSGAPTGVLATMNPGQTTGNGATLNIATDATAAVGSYTIKVKGTAQGNLADSVNVTLNVISPPSTAALSMPYCASVTPVWFAYRNEGYAWQTLAAAGNTFTFQATAKVATAAAYVIQTTQRNETDLEIIYADRSELASQSDRDCQGPKTVNGTVADISSGQSVRVSLGSALATVAAPNTSFAISGVADRVLDLTAVRGTVGNASNSLQVTPDKVIIRRSLNPIQGATLPALDFASESFTPATTSLTVANTGSGDLLNIASTLYTGTGSYGVVHVFQPTATTNNLFSVPGAQLQAGEMTELFIESRQANYSTGRQVALYLGALADRTETLGPVLSQPNMSTLTTVPYVRLRGQLPVQAEYPALTQFIWFLDGGAGADKLVYLVLSAAYLGGTPASTWDAVQPDFSGVSGFNATWALPGSSSTLTDVEAYSGRVALLFGAQPALDDVVKDAYRVQSGGALLRASSRPALMNPARRGPQYLRR